MYVIRLKSLRKEPGDVTITGYMPSRTALEDARRFIAEYIDSVAQLELLLLLRTTADRSWSIDALSSELRVDPAWVDAQMAYLCQHGFLSTSPGTQAAGNQARSSGQNEFRYSPRSEELEQAVTTVAQAYLLHRVSVIELIYGKPQKGIQAFADAFKLRASKESDNR